MPEMYPFSSKASAVTSACCPCVLTSIIIPVRCSARGFPPAIAAGFSLGCLLRSVASVLYSRGAAGVNIRVLAALVIPPGELQRYLPVLSRS